MQCAHQMMVQGSESDGHAAAELEARMYMEGVKYVISVTLHFFNCASLFLFLAFLAHFLPLTSQQSGKRLQEKATRVSGNNPNMNLLINDSSDFLYSYHTL